VPNLKQPYILYVILNFGHGKINDTTYAHYIICVSGTNINFTLWLKKPTVCNILHNFGTNGPVWINFGPDSCYYAFANLTSKEY